jgi:hypothetical protein
MIRIIEVSIWEVMLFNYNLIGGIEEALPDFFPIFLTLIYILPEICQTSDGVQIYRNR